MMPLGITEGWTAGINLICKIDGIMASSFSTGDTGSMILKAANGHVVSTTGDVVLVACSTGPYNATYTPDADDLKASRSPYSARIKVVDNTGAVQFFPHDRPDVWIVYSA
jgi:hypothetical protein